MKITYYSLLATVVLLITACSDKEENTQSNETIIQIDPNAPQHHTLKRMNGNELNITLTPGQIPKFKHIDISQYKGKILFLDFFKSDCQPCKDEIPHLVNLQNRYKDKFQIIGVNVGREEIEELNSFAQYHHINYPVIESGEEYFMTSVVGGIRGVPAMFMYDQNGDYFTHYLGAVPQAMIENDIKKLLGEE